VPLFRRRSRPSGPEPPRWVRVAVALHQPEAELLIGMLAELEIPAMVRRTTWDVPDMLAGGPRAILVPADRELEARALLDPLEPPGGGTGPHGAPESRP